MTSDKDAQTLSNCERVWATVVRMPVRQRGAGALISLIDLTRKLTPEQRQRFWYGKRGELKRSLWKMRSRGGGYEMDRAMRVAVVLKGMGMVNDSDGDVCDVATGKRVTTRLREIARLGYDWESEEGKAWLKENWGDAVSLPLAILKQWVRENNPKSRSFGEDRQPA